MGSYEAFMEFFLEILFYLSLGETRVIGTIFMFCFGLFMGAVAITGSVLVSKFTNVNKKLAITAGVFTALGLISTPFYNNMYCTYAREMFVCFEDLLSGRYQSMEALSMGISEYSTAVSIMSSIISIIGVVLNVSMILTLVLTGKCFKLKNVKYKALPIIAFILVFVRQFALSNIAISLKLFLPLNVYFLDGLFKVGQLCLFDIAFALPYVLLIPFAILNINKKEA